ncbi:MAG: hypothetical protein ACJZ8I_01240 [Paracoccaceae bacterium]
MDLKEIYLRQMDQNIKRQGELQEENNRILKEILKEIISIKKN